MDLNPTQEENINTTSKISYNLNILSSITVTSLPNEHITHPIHEQTASHLQQSRNN